MTPVEARKYAHRLLKVWGKIKNDNKLYFEEDTWEKFMTLPNVKERYAVVHRNEHMPIHVLMRANDVLGAQALIMKLILGDENEP